MNNINPENTPATISSNNTPRGFFIFVSIKEIGYFDTYPQDSHNNGVVNNQRSGDPGGHDGNKGHNSPFFNGAWSVYPYFQSRNIIISDINLGLFIVRKSTN